METFDVVVIGSGPGGYVAAIHAAQLGMKVACIEKDPTLGGTCLNIGCIPSKALLYSSKYFDTFLHHGKEHGIVASEIRCDLTAMMKRKDKVVKSLTEGVAFLFKKNKVTWIKGTACLKDPFHIQITQENETSEVEAKHVILATGSEPIALPFLPFDEERILSSTGALALQDIPKKMVVIGAGVIGLELGSVYRRLGTEVTVVELLDSVCPMFDSQISKELLKIFTKQGMVFHLSSKVVSATRTPQGVTLECMHKDGSSFHLESEVVLVSIGRKPYSKDLGIHELGINLDKQGRVIVNRSFQTTLPHIYAIGDLIDGPMLAHKASEEGICAVDAIAGKATHFNYSTISNVMYTWPEVACVGMTEKEAVDAGLKISIGTFPFQANARARCQGDHEGLVKIVAEKKSQKVLGVHMIGPNVSEMIGEASLAIEKQLSAHDLAYLCHAHPTCSEAIKEAALDIYQQRIHL